MPYLLERHKVQDYDQWRAVFDEDARNRAASGSRGARIFCNADEPSELVVLFEWESLETARQRVESQAVIKYLLSRANRRNTNAQYAEQPPYPTTIRRPFFIRLLYELRSIEGREEPGPSRA